jgi:twinkle protein
MIQQLQSLGINVRAGQHGNVKVPCPQCSHTRKHKSDPCLSVLIEEGVYNCHHCDFKGTVKMVTPKKEYVKPPAELKNLSPNVIAWFEARGITNQTLLRFKISQGLDYMPQVGSEVNTIHFNYIYNGEVYNIKYRDRNKNFKLVSGAMLGPFGIDVVLDNSSSELVITEGEIDAMSFFEAGVKTAISVPNGASKGSQKLDWLEEFIHVFDGKKIYLATDMDEAGIALRNELARRLGKDNCYIIEFPHKDANETLVKEGKEALLNCYNSATAFPVDGIDDASSVRDELYQLFESGTPEGYTAGYEMDNEFIWHPGQVTLVTGIPGHGKSTFLKNIIYRLAAMHGLKSFIYSAEEANTAFALSDMYQIATGKSFFSSQFSERMSKQDLEEYMPFMNDHFKYYRLYDNDLSIDGIIEKAKGMVKRFGINILVIDNMSTVEKSMSNQTDTRHHQIKVMMTDVSRFARNYGVHVFLVAHPKKMTELKSGVYKVPSGYDVGDSSHFYNLPDNGITVYRNMETRQTEIHRWKVRFKYTGQVGTSFFTFNINNSRYISAERINDGTDKTKFIGQPITKNDIQSFASLADSV